MLKRIEVKWLDATSDDQHRPLSEGAKLIPEITYTRGFLVSDEPDHIVIVRDYIPMAQDMYDERGGGYISIPRLYVQDIKIEGAI